MTKRILSLGRKQLCRSATKTHDYSNFETRKRLFVFIRIIIRILPIIVRAWLKNWKLYTLQLSTSTLFSQHLKVIVVGLPQTERVLPRTLTTTTIASTDISNSTAMLSDWQITVK